MRRVREFETSAVGFLGFIEISATRGNTAAVIEASSDLRLLVRRFIADNIEPRAAK